LFCSVTKKQTKLRQEYLNKEEKGKHTLIHGTMTRLLSTSPTNTLKKRETEKKRKRERKRDAQLKVF